MDKAANGLHNNNVSDSVTTIISTKLGNYVISNKLRRIILSDGFCCVLC